MSVRALDVITEAAILIEDPNMERITKPRWSALLDRTQRKMAQRLELCEAEAIFDLVIDTRYAWPDDMVRMKWVAVTETPDDPDSYRFLREMFEEEWRMSTDGQYPSGTPYSYFARQAWWHPFPAPDVEILNGGLFAYFYQPAAVVDVDTEFLVIPEVARDHLVDGLLVVGHRALKQYAEARDLERAWLEHEVDVKSAVQDRSDDRRKQFRPAGPGWSGAQV